MPAFRASSATGLTFNSPFWNSVQAGMLLRQPPVEPNFAEAKYRAMGSLPTSSSLTLTSTPVEGDILIVMVQTVGTAVTIGASGMGAEWSVVYSSTDEFGQDVVLKGVGATTAGPVTVTLSSARSGQYSVHRVSGVPSPDINITRGVGSSLFGYYASVNLPIRVGDVGITGLMVRAYEPVEGVDGNQIPPAWPSIGGALSEPMVDPDDRWHFEPITQLTPASGGVLIWGGMGTVVPEYSTRFTTDSFQMSTNVHIQFASSGNPAAPPGVPQQYVSFLQVALVPLIEAKLDITLPSISARIIGAPVSGVIDVTTPSLSVSFVGKVPTVARVAVTTPSLSVHVDGMAGVPAGPIAVTTPSLSVSIEGEVSDVPPIEARLAMVTSLTVEPTISVPGEFLNPLPIGDSPRAIDFTDAVDTAQPAAEHGDAGTHDLWFDLTSGATSDLTLTWTGSPGVGIELWAAPEGEVVTDVSQVTLLDSSATGVLTTSVGEQQRYLVRVYPLDPADNSASGSLAWSFAPRPSGLLELWVDAVAYDPPCWLRVSVISATPLGDVEFSIDGGSAVFDEVADESGSIVGFTVPIPQGTALGLHTLTALDVATGQTSTKEFEVAVYTSSAPAEPPAIGPTTPASEEDVIRWVFELALPMGGTGSNTAYTFPNNPHTMSTPHAPKAISADHTTAPDGQPILWEGQGPPTDWTVEGFCFDQAHAEALELWQSRNRRFWLIDHLQRAWVVTFETLDWTPVRDTNHRWAQRYRAKFFIYEGPVSLS